MKMAKVYVNNQLVAHFFEVERGKNYRLEYVDGYHGTVVSLTLPPTQKIYEFKSFPPFFDGLLPEGQQLQALLKQRKLDEHDYFEHLLAVGRDLVGPVTVEAGL